MTDEQQNENPMPTPPPLPGQIFIRPGIDDRPDLDKALTPEDKEALARLAVKQNPRPPAASGDRPEVQAAQ
ncbi:MAG TPA: MFS transporter, partial [Bifidobacterium pullorum]|nr:MFS transporter [Bifidobacterium pullorum]